MRSTRNPQIVRRLQRVLARPKVQTGYMGNSSNREHGIHSVAAARIAASSGGGDAVAGDESCGPTIAVYRRLSQWRLSEDRAAKASSARATTSTATRSRRPISTRATCSRAPASPRRGRMAPTQCSSRCFASTGCRARSAPTTACPSPRIEARARPPPSADRLSASTIVSRRGRAARLRVISEVPRRRIRRERSHPADARARHTTPAARPP